MHTSEDGPGPSEYYPRPYEWENLGGRGKGEFLQDPMLWRSESMCEYKERVGLDPVGPGAYDNEKMVAGLDFLSTYARGSRCSAVLAPPSVHTNAAEQVCVLCVVYDVCVCLCVCVCVCVCVCTCVYVYIYAIYIFICIHTYMAYVAEEV